MEPHITVPGKLLRSYLVYGWRRGEKYLYIGLSGVGLTRLNNGHHVFGRDKLLSTDEIDVWYCDSRLEAGLLESKLIKEHKPKHNKMYNQPERKVEKGETFLCLGMELDKKTYKIIR